MPDIFPALTGSSLMELLERQFHESDGFLWGQEHHYQELALASSAMGLGEQKLSGILCRPMAQGKTQMLWLEFHPRNREASHPVNTGTGDDRFPVLLESVTSGIVTVDNFGFIQAINRQLADTLGYDADALIDKPLRLVFPDLAAASGNENYKQLADNLIRQRGDRTLAAITLDGRPINLDIQVFDVVGVPNRWTLYCSDRGQNRRQEAALQRQRQVIDAIFSHTSDTILLVNKRGLVEEINPVGAEMLGISHRRRDQLYVDEVLHLRDDEGVAINPVALATIRQRPVDLVNLTLEQPNGGQASVVVTAVPVRDQGNRLDGCMIILRAVSEARRISSRLSWHETHDPLTQLANRRQLENEVIRAIDNAHMERCSHGLLYIDLYNFSMINETCGHAAGDEMLRGFAKLLAGAAETSDVVSRVGNDEFAILLWHRSAEEIRERADSIMAMIAGFIFPWQERRFRVGASIGVEIISSETISETEILLAARVACSVAKDMGRNRVHFPEQGKEIQSRHSISQLATSISEALEEDRFVLYCQPIVPLNGQRVIKHYEVLVRMVQRDGQIVSPGEFVPAAETSGLIDDVDRWVLERLLTLLERMPAEQRRRLSFSVNLSGYTIGDEKFLDHVVARLQATNLEPGVLNFEVTETAAVKHFDRAIAFINAMSRFGCSFALDDFGIGLSSFSYLKKLPVKYLKIDGSFIRRMEEEDVDYSMVSTINHLAHVMGLATIAEYVEKQSQETLLREIGVDYGQGYYFALPEPIERVLQIDA